MKIFVDENIPSETVAELRSCGHDVTDIRGGLQQGISDETLWQIVLQEQRLLVTTDKGFNQYREQSHQGILIVRLRQPNAQKIHQRIMQAINQFSEQEWLELTVVMRDSVQSIWRKS